MPEAMLRQARGIIIGFVSDRTLVRKPYMLAGSLTTVVVTILFIGRIGIPTSGGLMIVFLSLFGITMAVGYVTWMAAYTETIEDINPALVATGEQLDEWLSRVKASRIRELQGFVTGVMQDKEADKAGLTLPASNRVVEGKVNKLKLIKRMGYGRAGFALLRQRVLHAL